MPSEIRSPGLSLIQDAYSRGIRTTLQQLVLVALEAAGWWAVGLDLSGLDSWQVGLIGLGHVVLSAVVAYVHRSLLDPSPVPSAAPPDTPTFRPAPLEPPVPRE